MLTTCEDGTVSRHGSALELLRAVRRSDRCAILIAPTGKEVVVRT